MNNKTKLAAKLTVFISSAWCGEHAVAPEKNMTAKQAMLPGVHCHREANTFRDLKTPSQGEVMPKAIKRKPVNSDVMCDHIIYRNDRDAMGNVRVVYKDNYMIYLININIVNNRNMTA